MGLTLDTDKLLAHLQSELEKRTDARAERPAELAEWFYGPGGSEEPENMRDMRKLYNEAYWDGAADLLAVVLTFDDDLRGVEALAKLVDNLRPAEG